MEAVKQFLSCGNVLYKVVLTLKSLDETLMCDHPNESSTEHYFLWCCHYAEQGGSNFWDCGWILLSAIIQMKAIEQYFPVVLFIMLYKVVLTLESG